MEEEGEEVQGCLPFRGTSCVTGSALMMFRSRHQLPLGGIRTVIVETSLGTPGGKIDDVAGNCS